MNPTTAAHLLALLPLAFVSLILPWYGQSRRGVLFGVTVSLDFADTPEAQSALRSYRRNVFAVVLALFVLAAAIIWIAPANSAAVAAAPLVAILLDLVVAYLLWRRGATAIKPYAAAMPLERHADLVPVSTTLPLLATAGSLLPLAVTAIILHLYWNQIPLRFVQHWNASGEANRWATRSFDGVFGPIVAGAMTVLLLTAGSVFMSRANGPQMSQRRRALVPMGSLAWLIAGIFCVLSLRPLLHFTSSTLLLISAAYLVLVFGLSLWLLQRSGLAPYSKSTESYDSTPDSGWYAGVFYYNPADAAVIVPKRFGWGWTFNFARPASWMVLGAILLFTLSLKVFIK
ncbi:MAG: DUF5808 domain-containing protein [Opitutaceae bacterium]|nr:DUF5808 domain-containing protein [Opitutaceae bacterium]